MLGSEPFVKEARICSTRKSKYEINQCNKGKLHFYGYICAIGIGIETCTSCTYTVHVNDVPKGNLWVLGSNSFVDLRGLVKISVVHFFLRADEKCVNIVLQQKLIPVSAESIFCLVGTLETIQSRP